MQKSTRADRTVSAILKTATGYLREKGCESPRLDAEVLLAHILGTGRVELYTGHDRPLMPAELDKYRDMVKRRAAGEPAAYLVGYREFYSLEFGVGPGVLVPRPETEFLVAAAIDEAKSKGGTVRAADIGTGSGCIAVALAVFAAGCEVVATENSQVAAEYARKNVNAQNVHERVTVAEGEWFEPLRRMGLVKKLDMVLSNPPYIARGEFESLPATVRDYEPVEALVAGDKGTECLERIVKEAPEFLFPGGLLILEAGAGQFDTVAQVIRDTGFFVEPRGLEDYGSVKRVVLARRK